MKKSEKLKRRLSVTAGNIASGLGVIGIVLTILPTTAFLLISSKGFIISTSWTEALGKLGEPPYAIIG
jgi:uncharacterized membrane protein YbaN (DUF454 family)